jgi:hypothetical protein
VPSAESSTTSAGRQNADADRAALGPTTGPDGPPVMRRTPRPTAAPSDARPGLHTNAGPSVAPVASTRSSAPSVHHDRVTAARAMTLARVARASAGCPTT